MDPLGIIMKVLSVTKTVSDAAQDRAPRKDGYAAPDCYAFNGSVERYFAEVFSAHFPEYTVQRNVHVNLSCEDHVPVTFMLCKDGRQKLAVILCHAQEYRRKPILNTMRACEALHIPVQRYYTNFRNERSYVRKRVSEALN